MSKSGNPVTRAKELKISQVGDFKKRLGGVFELPSGLVMRLRNPGGVSAFLANGTIPNSLMQVVQEHIDKGQGVQPEEIAKAGQAMDPKMMEEMIEALNSIIIQCAVEPTVLPKPESEDDRDEDQLYADEIPDDDKMFVFQWVSGGTSDLEQFRRQHGQAMDDLAAVAGAGNNSR